MWTVQFLSSPVSLSSYTFYLTLLMIVHIVMKNNSSYGIKDCIYAFQSPTIRLPLVIELC